MKAYDLALLDLRGLAPFTDVFLLCSARNPRQVRAIAERLKRVARSEESRLLHGRIEGAESARWVVLDLNDVVVHIFDEPMRGFYDLDGLWQDAPRLAVPETPAEALQLDARSG